MNKQIRLLLNIKPAEVPMVKQLFLIQFFLGVATSFLFISSLTMFLSAFDGKTFPKAYIVAAILLLIANTWYARLEKKYAPHKLLQVIILFSVGSITATWIAAIFFTLHLLPFFLAAWNLVVYMLVGYAFWGMAAVMYNVRESKRLFTVVGSGDIPAKMLGYAAVAILAPLVGVANLLLVSVAVFILIYYLLIHFKNLHISAGHTEDHHPVSPSNDHGIYLFFKELFEHRLIFFISLWSVVAFTIYAFIDFTFLIEVKARYTSQHQLATFVGVFFIIGRFLAILFKLFLSSRLISRLGLTNSLLISPIMLLVITSTIYLPGNDPNAHLYLFGVMVLVAEILKSVVQDPVFFVLFQPLKPHLRLKGHLIAKGYTLPFALLGSGIFLAVYLNYHDHIPINFMGYTIAVLIAGWILTILLLKKAYLATLMKAIEKGYFTGTELFLNQKSIRKYLVAKTQSQNPKEIIYALVLLERSAYRKLKKLWLQLLPMTPDQVKIFILSRVIQYNMSAALPSVQQLLSTQQNKLLKFELIKTNYFLQKEFSTENKFAFNGMADLEKKAALIGVFSQPENNYRSFAEKELNKLAASHSTEDKILAISTIMEIPMGDFSEILKKLLADSDPFVYKKAILAVGKTKCFSLLPLVFDKVIPNQLYAVLQETLIKAGDDIYVQDYLIRQIFPIEITTCLIKVAGKIKGGNSDNYLAQCLSGDYPDKGIMVESLWSKKALMLTEKLIPLENWVQKTLDNAALKIFYYQCLIEKECVLLKSALKSEIEQDLQRILKAYALLYNRSAVDRIIHLYHFGDATAFSNAVEMLENVLPKKYFAKTDSILEFLRDVKYHKSVDFSQKKISLPFIMSDILTHNKAGCNFWTKSVAYYTIPNLKQNPIYYDLLLKQNLAANTNFLLKETRDYALFAIA